MASPTDDAIPQFPGTGSSIPAVTSRLPIFNDGDPQQRMISVTDLGVAIGNTALGLDSITQTVDYDDFTDGGAALGTLTMTDYVPAGAILLGSKVLVSAGFAGDTSATLTISDGSDADRFNTGTPSVFATAATGIQTGVPSGDKLITTAVQPILRVTSNAAYAAVNAGTMAVTIYFIRTVAA